MEELISVLMSVYKEPLKYIKDSVESVLNQTYRYFEFIIIVDDPDNSDVIQLLHEYRDQDSRIRIICNEKNIGLAKSLNKGLLFCSGTYIARMDADDICSLDRLEKQKQYLEEQRLDLIGSEYDTFFQEPEERLWVQRVPGEKEVDSRLRVSSCLPHPSWFGKKEVFIENNGYRDILACEDYDFLIRARTLNYKLGNIKKILLHYRLNPNSISHSRHIEQKAIFKYLSYHYRKNDIVTFEEYEEFVNDSYDYGHLKRAYDWVFHIKGSKGLRKVISAVRLIAHPKTLRVYLKYK